MARHTVGLLEVLRTVLSGMIGVRRKSRHEDDMARLDPTHVILAALGGAALFVLILLLVVRAVTAD